MIHAYRRVSKTDQQLGPQAQQDGILRWYAARENPPELRDYLDMGISAGIPLAERPAGAELLSALKPGDMVVTYKLDRLFRSTANAAVTLEDWCKRGINLATVKEGFDFSTAHGRFMASIMAAFAELERDMIRERTRAALAVCRKKGVHMGQVPYGFDIIAGRRQVNGQEQEIIASMRQWRAAGAGCRRIAEKLNQMCTPTKSGGIWNYATVAKILRRHPFPTSCNPVNS